MKKLFAAWIVVSFATLASADVILQYTFTGQVLTPSTQAPNTSGSSFTNSQGVISFGTATASTATGGPNAPSVGAANWVTAVSNYWSFTLTLDPGYVLVDSPTPLSLSFTYRSSGTGPTMYEWKYNSGGGWNVIGWGPLTANSAWQPAVTNAATVLAGEGGTIEFRLYGSGTTAAGGTWNVDQVTFTGSVIPEPGTMVMLGVGVVGLLIARRFRS